MAGFKTHITTSTLLGIGYGGAAHLWYGVPLDQCLLATGLCSVAGMLPDLDSDNGVPLRESLAFGAAVVPMLLIDRFRHLGISTDAMVLCAAMIYIAIRFGFGKMLRAYTRHRGMFHSIPAALIFAELAFLICDCPQMELRLFKASAVLVGFMSHLLLDEFYSIQWSRMRIKKSFGTAMKLWDKVWWANISAYGKLVLLTYVIINEPAWMPKGEHHDTPQIVNSPVETTQPRSAESEKRQPLRR